MWLLTSLLALPLVAAQGPLEFIGGIWDKFLTIGSLSFIGVSSVVPFTRILIWILTFALFFAVAAVLGKRKEGTPLFSRSQSMIVAAVLATISAIFLPAAAILAVGAGWATAVGLILIGAPIVGLGYVLWKIPSDENGKSLPDSKGTVLLKLLISMLLFWILSAMNSSLQSQQDFGSATVAGTMANFIAWALYINSIMIIWYIIKFFFTSSDGSEEADKRWQEGGKKMGKWLGKKMEAQKAQEEMGRRAQEVREPKSYLVDAIEDCKGLVNSLSVASPAGRSAAVSKAEKHLKSLRKNLKKAVRSLRRLRRKERSQENARIYEIFDNLHTNAGVALVHAKNISIPKSSASDQEWRDAHAAIQGTAGIISAICGKMVNALNVFMEQSLEAAQKGAAFRVEQQAQGRQEAQQVVQQKAQEQAQARRGRMASRPVGVVRTRRK